MKKKIELYIGDELVELSSESVISLNYTLEDTANPTIVKNMFSRSIDVPGTSNNNRIFGRYYDLTRRASLSPATTTGVDFNPLKRTPFTLYINSELVEQGYIQLNSVSMRNGIAWYTITLFGGLGDFFYNLMYDENGDKRTLASLEYSIVDMDSGDAQMDFSINKDRVNEAWNNLGNGYNLLSEVITHIPAYNGIPADFDAQHALINTYQSQIGLTTEITDGGNRYSPYNGYAVVEFPKSLDEWETRDLRSYMQRPALQLSSLIRAIADESNNGGYKVNLDATFFNEENSLYHDAYITLPMLKTTEQESPITEIPLSTAKHGSIGGSTQTTTTEISLGSCSLSSYPTGASISVNIPISLKLGAVTSNSNELYIDFATSARDSSGWYRTDYAKRALVARVVVRDRDTDEIITTSPNVALSYLGQYQRGWSADYNPMGYPDKGYTNVKGYFTRASSSTPFTFVDMAGNNTIPVVAEFVRGQHVNIACAIEVYFAYDNYIYYGSNNPDVLYDANSYTGNDYSNIQQVVRAGAITGITTEAIAPNGTVSISTEDLPTISSGAKITKQLLLGNTPSPAEYLLSYAKLFGLRFVKDVASKTITITSKYFRNDIIDINDRIDRGSDINIIPNVFDTKFLRLALDTPDTFLAKKYRKEYGVDYGQKRIDTAYEFNNETTEIYSDNIYEHAVPCRATSRLFYNYKNSGGNTVHPPLAEDVKYTLFRNLASGLQRTSTELISKNIVDSAKTSALNATAGYDAMPKMCYFDMSDGQREPVDIANNLVIYCGNYTSKDINGNTITYMLTDDVGEMIKLNGKICYLLTESSKSASNMTIAIARTSLPLFLSVRLINNIVYNSFDFAVPKEDYIAGIAYDESTTLYNRYWAKLYNDRIDIDTRKVSAMVDLSGIKVTGDMLRQFYYFDGCFWLLNKIEDYDPAIDKLTKCEFIKVKEISNYYNGSEEITTTEE